MSDSRRMHWTLMGITGLLLAGLVVTTIVPAVFSSDADTPAELQESGGDDAAADDVGDAATTQPSLQAALPAVDPVAVAEAHPQRWSRFRGPNGSGQSDLEGVPTEWTMDDYRWRIDLPGWGHSSPIVWDGALFVTSGDESGRRTLHRIDAQTGREVWTRDYDLQTDRLHQFNSYGSGTPATDGEHVFVAHADDRRYVLLSYDFDGNVAWERDLGTFITQHGIGFSPVLFEDLLFVINDQVGPSSVIALDKATGEPRWKTSYGSRLEAHTSYATPMILQLPEQPPQLICVPGTAGLSGLNPYTGEILWSAGPLPIRTVASPVYGNGLLTSSCGEGGMGRLLLTVDPTGHGNVARTHIRNAVAAGSSYVPTPVVRGEHLYTVSDNGIATCVEMATGELVSQKRLDGSFFSSPILIRDRIYAVSKAGVVFVIEASPDLTLLGESSLEDDAYASPAVAGGCVYLRGFRTLSCLPAGGGETGAPRVEGL